MTDPRKPLGHRCEAIAADYLERKGLRIRHRNWRCKLGEVDLIAEHGATTVFIEVKARRSLRFGGGAEAVGPRKQARMIAIAQLYMQRAPNRACRFDVVSVSWVGSAVRIEHLADAFP